MQKAEKRLLDAIRAQRVSHAFFISCADPAPAAELARRAAALLCTGEPEVSRLANCADYMAYDGAALRMDDVRALIESLSRSPLDGRMRAVVIEGAHAMSPAVQNALLKTLEEPPSATAFLLTGNIAAVLPTVASRCAVLRVGLPTAADAEEELLSRGAKPAEARLYSAAGGGSLTRALRLYEDEGFRKLREDSLEALLRLLRGELPLSVTRKLSTGGGAAEAFSFMLSFLRDVLALQCGGGSAPENPDRRDEARKAAAHFTSGQVTGMIERLAGAAGELYAGSAGAMLDNAVMDRLFLEIAEAITDR